MRKETYKIVYSVGEKGEKNIHKNGKVTLIFSSTGDGSATFDVDNKKEVAPMEGWDAVYEKEVKVDDGNGNIQILKKYENWYFHRIKFENDLVKKHKNGIKITHIQTIPNFDNINFDKIIESVLFYQVSGGTSGPGKGSGTGTYP